MISDVLNQWQNSDLIKFLISVTDSDVKFVIGKEKLDEKDLLILLSERAQFFLEEMAERSREITLHQFGKTINLFTPLYLSNYCSNVCLYCGFNHTHNIARKKLSSDEIRREAVVISRLGLNHILILTGGDRKNSDPDYILEAVKILKEYFSSISIEIYALTVEEYVLFMENGVDHVTIYQETYNRDLYKKLHLSGEKADYDFRLNAPERAASAGAFSVNLGVLLGLDNPVLDFYKVCLHGDYLRKKYPGTSIAMSFPRICPAEGGFSPAYSVSNQSLVQFITAFRLFMPRGEISISTRESSELRDHLLPLGVTKMSAGSSTAVGNRSGESSSEQFAISDNRSVSDMDRDLRASGFQPVYKDWMSL